jgi:hypothetical protein
VIIEHVFSKIWAFLLRVKGYGIDFGEDDWESFKKLNVVTLNGGDGDLECSKELCKITVTAY